MSAATTRHRQAKLTLGAAVAIAVIVNARPAEAFSTTGLVMVSAASAARAAQTGPPPMTPATWTRLARLARSVNTRANGGGLTARDLFQKIPTGVRMQGQEAVGVFLDGNHVSHIQSVRNNPALAADPLNLIFEPRASNLARGARNMTLIERNVLRLRNAATSLAAARRAIFAAAGRGARIGAIAELPVTVIEQSMHYKYSGKTGAEAIRDGAATIGVVSATSAAGAAALQAGAAVGITVSGTILMPVVVIGGIAYTGVAAKRIWDALPAETQSAILTESDSRIERTREVLTEAWRRVQRRLRELGEWFSPGNLRRMWREMTRNPIATRPSARPIARAGAPARAGLTATSRTLYAPPFDDPDELRAWKRAQLREP